MGTYIVANWAASAASGDIRQTSVVWHWASQADRPRIRGGIMGHDESMVTGGLPAGSRISTRIIRPDWHCGHCRSEEPVRSS